jgi:hypothetical protein
MTRTVVFVCPHGDAKSRLAAASFNRVAPPGWQATSAGQHPQEAVSVLAERLVEGTELEAHLDRGPPRGLETLPASAHLVAIDCELPGATHWSLEQQTMDEAMREELRQRAETLAEQLEHQ